jgi:membrane protein
MIDAEATQSDRLPARAGRALRARAASTRTRLGRTAVGASVRRAREIDLGSCALLLAAQQLMCTIPLLIVLAAIRPLAGPANFGVQLSHFLSLSPKATADLGSLFAATASVRNAASVSGILLLVVFALGSAQAHQRAYELAWRLEPGKRGSWHRQSRWVAAMIAYVASLAVIGRLVGDTAAARPLFIAAYAPLTAAFFVYGQRILLGGRVPRRSLLPGGLIIAAALTALVAISPVLLSGQVTTSVREFGPIGVTFVLAGWLLGFSVLVVAGALGGAALVTRRSP